MGGPDSAADRDLAPPAQAAQELEDGAVRLCKALLRHYVGTGGHEKKARDDMTKLRYAPGLTRAAKRLLLNIEHTSRHIPGTHATRRQMWFDTHANRVRYGVPIFVAFSPGEAHNILRVRLSRVRRKRPGASGWQRRTRLTVLLARGSRRSV